MITITIRNEHSGTTFTEQFAREDAYVDRVRWYAERSERYAPGWTITQVTRA